MRLADDTILYFTFQCQQIIVKWFHAEYLWKPEIDTQLTVAARHHAASLKIVDGNLHNQLDPDHIELAPRIDCIQINDGQIFNKTLHTDICTEVAAMPVQAFQTVHRYMQRIRFCSAKIVVVLQKFRLFWFQWLWIAAIDGLVGLWRQWRRQILIIWHLKITNST